MTILTKSNFSETVRCNQDFKLIIGVAASCAVCKKLVENLTKKNIAFGSIDLNENPEVLRSLRRTGKLTNNNIGIPLIMIYNNHEFVKISPVTTNPDQIAY